MDIDILQVYNIHVVVNKLSMCHYTLVIRQPNGRISLQTNINSITDLSSAWLKDPV